jgi:phosphoribosylanthranilate isomerase
MTKIKFCGLRRPEDIYGANTVKPDYIGFVFVKNTRRFVEPEKAMQLRKMLSPNIRPVGVFVDEKPENVARLLDSGVIDIAQLHGHEDEDYIAQLRHMTDKEIIKAYRISSPEDIAIARSSTADHILLDSGAGTGGVFDWQLIKAIDRPYFLAGGLNCENVSRAVEQMHPFALDVSSGIETGGIKDIEKMAAFASAVRKEDRL